MRTTRAAAALLAALFAASCGSNPPTLTTSPAASPTAAPRTAGPSPSATTMPTAAPTATAVPVDVAEAFVSALSDPQYQARMTVTGSMTISGVVFPITGVTEVSRGDSHNLLSIALPGGDQTTETIKVAGTSYEVDHGVWVKSSPTAASAGGTTGTSLDLNTLTGTVGGLRDTGVETHAGRSLHHLVLPSGISLPVAVFGLTDPSISNPSLSLEFWAEDDGNPAAMTMAASWDQQASGKTVPVTMTIDYAIASTLVTISAPTELWAWRTSKTHKYQVAYPADWEVQAAASAKKDDYYVGWDGSYVGVYRHKTGGSTLNQITSYITKHLATWSALKSAKLTSNKAITVDGVKGRVLTYRGTYQGDKEWVTEVVLVKGSYVTFVWLVTYHTQIDADRELFNTVLDTFTFK
jgi:hypothetical protein